MKLCKYIIWQGTGASRCLEDFTPGHLSVAMRPFTLLQRHPVACHVAASPHQQFYKVNIEHNAPIVTLTGVLASLLLQY